MEYIAPSTKFTQALANAIRLSKMEITCRERGELHAWLERTIEEVEKLNAYAAIEDTLRQQTTDPHLLQNINEFSALSAQQRQHLRTRIEIVKADLHYSRKMEYIPASTRPTEALANASRLCQMRIAYQDPSEAQAWVNRAIEELDQLAKFLEEGETRRLQTNDPHILLHIDELCEKLNKQGFHLAGCIGVVEANIQYAQKDDWNLPPTQVSATPSLIGASPKNTQPVTSSRPTVASIQPVSISYKAGRAVGKTTAPALKGFIAIVSIVFICGVISSIASFNQSSTQIPAAPTPVAVNAPAINPYGAVCTQDDLNYINTTNPLDKILTTEFDILEQTVNQDMSRASRQQILNWLANLATKTGTFKLHITQLRGITPSPRFATVHYQVISASDYYAAYLDNILSVASTGDYAYVSQGEYNYAAMREVLNRAKQDRVGCLG